MKSLLEHAVEAMPPGAAPVMPVLLAATGITDPELLIYVGYGLLVLVVLDWRLGKRQEEHLRQFKMLVDRNAVIVGSKDSALSSHERRLRALEQKEAGCATQFQGGTSAKLVELQGRVAALEARLGHR